MIPGRVGGEDVTRLLGGIEGYRDRAGWVFVTLEEQGVDVLRRKRSERLIAQLIAADRTDDPRVPAEAGGMAGEIGRCAAEVGRIWKDVPEDLPEADDIRADDFWIHLIQ